MTESVDLLTGYFPDSAESFGRLGIAKNGIYKRIENAIENVFCVILSADLHLGAPGTDEDILENLMQHGAFDREMRQSLKAKGSGTPSSTATKRSTTRSPSRYWRSTSGFRPLSAGSREVPAVGGSAGFRMKQEPGRDGEIRRDRDWRMSAGIESDGKFVTFDPDGILQDE
ncbi:hypothetical protein [Methanoculleus caldifontis]